MKYFTNNIYTKAGLPGIALLLAFQVVQAQTVAPTANKPDGTTVNPGTVTYPGLQNLSGAGTVGSPGRLNYIRTTVPDVPLQSIPAGSYYYRQSSSYFDGLGRPLQTVARKGHADGNDLVSIHVYDSMGRETYQYLPYAAPTGGINYAAISGPGKMKFNVNTQLLGFYNEAGQDEQPYSQTIFESSPLGRPVKQMAPGKSWVGSARGVSYDYRTNDEPLFAAYSNTYAVKGAYPHFTVGNNMGDLPVYAGNYSPGQLYVTSLRDEDGKLSEEVKDKSGKVLMKRNLFQTTAGSFAASNTNPNVFPDNYAYTIYVYDDLGRLRVVMPPEASKPVPLSLTQPSGGLGSYGSYNYSWSLSAAQLTGLCYQYLYDERGRLVEKKIPGKEVEYYIYDKRDRLIMYQDGNMRNGSQPVWHFTFYDVLDRPTVTGYGNSGASRTVLINNYLNTPTEYPPNDFLYYMKRYDLYHAYPASLIGCKILSYTYYDDYTQGGLSGFGYDEGQFAGITYPNNNTVVHAPDHASTMTRGLPTGAKVRIMDPANPNADNWLTTVNYYDDKGRVIQTQSQNLQGGTDISSNIYFFQGMLYKNILKHRNPNAVAVPFATDGAITEYRLENTFERSLGMNGGNEEVWLRKQKINGSIDYHLSAYGYDHLGRNVLKQFTAGLNFQNYNIRGFLGSIAFDKYDLLDTIFNEKLYYDRGFASKLYNGNIAGITWAGSDHVQRAYGYTYDNLNRLTHAEFRQKDGTDWNQDDYDYTASNITYDLNGNIKSMDQVVTPPMNGGTVLAMDQLTYTYAANSNKLVKVEDAVPAAYTANFSLPDFKNGASTAEEYHYDGNGNMITDDNKHITSITYNYLNKPETINVAGGQITYVYDAAGNRLQKRVTDLSNSSNNETWDYTGNFVYKNNELQYILNEEGRARPVPVEVQNSSPAQYLTRFVYDYFVKDHLGNVRSTVTSEPINGQYRASHELVSANTENLVFDHIPQVRDVKPATITPVDVGDEYAARLNGGEADRRVGTALVLMTKAGDRFRLNVNAFYEGEYTQRDNAGTEELMESLMGTLMNGTTPSGEVFGETRSSQVMQQVFADPNLASQLADLTNTGNNTGAPKAHLNYLWFNDKLELDMSHSGSFQVVQNTTGSGWTTIGTGSGGGLNTGQAGGGGTGTATMGDGGVYAPGVGMLVVYIDNQSIGKDVWFDNLVVDNYTSTVLEEDHYYPFGLTLNTAPNTATATGQPYKYQGIELEKRFGLEQYETLNRILDPQLGIFRQIDPKAELDYSLSPFASMRNNPAYYTDPFGDVAGDFLDKGGKVIGNDGNDDGKVYVVKTTQKDFDSDVPSAGISKDEAKATEKFIKDNSGKTDAFKSNDIAYKNSVEIVGSSEARQEMANVVNQDNGTGGTTAMNNREYGGTVNNDGTVVPSAPGDVTSPAKTSHASIDFSTTSATMALFHSHPSGQVVEGSQNNGTTIAVSGTTRTYNFKQAPSNVDIENINNRTGYVFGKRDGTVYIYNKQGVQATLPAKRFVTPKR